MKNKSGFTMIELLATITILGIIMLLAVPNVLSIIDKNKKRTYVEDAKKIQVLAEYELRSNPVIEKPKNGYSIVITLGNLDMTELQSGPEGGEYSTDKSFVVISNEGGTYKYYVTLREEHSTGVSGLNLTDIDLLNSEGAIRYVVSGSDLHTYTLAISAALKRSMCKMTTSAILPRKQNGRRLLTERTSKAKMSHLPKVRSNI